MRFGKKRQTIGKTVRKSIDGLTSWRTETVYPGISISTTRHTEMNVSQHGTPVVHKVKTYIVAVPRFPTDRVVISRRLFQFKYCRFGRLLYALIAVRMENRSRQIRWRDIRSGACSRSSRLRVEDVNGVNARRYSNEQPRHIHSVRTPSRAKK